MKYIKITGPDVENGLGFRTTLWISGCKCHCEGCHNPETWSFTFGKEFTDESYQELKENLSKPYIKGLTLSGGNPVDSPEDLLSLLKRVREDFGNSKDIWLYSGYVFEDLLKDPLCKEILGLVDIVVDGPFILSKRNTALPFRGSENQRIIRVQESLKEGIIILKQ